MVELLLHKKEETITTFRKYGDALMQTKTGFLGVSSCIHIYEIIYMLKIKGDRIFLQEFTTENLHDPQYFSWLRDLEIVTNIYRLEYLKPIQFTEVEKYVNNLLLSQQDCFFAIYTNKAFIGTLRLGHINWRSGIADIGILIGNKKYWGKGLAQDSIRTACTYAFGTLSLRKLTAGTPATNIPMIKCFHKLGFKEEGCLRQQLLMNGAYIDHILFGLLKEEFMQKGRRE